MGQALALFYRGRKLTPTGLVSETQGDNAPEDGARIHVQICRLHVLLLFSLLQGGPSEELCSEISFISHLEHGAFLFGERKK